MNKGYKSNVKALFTSEEIKHQWKVSVRCLQNWDREGIVTCTKRGPRKKRYYSFIDVLQVRIIKRLRDEGVSLWKIKMAVERLRRDSDIPQAPLVKLNLVTDGQGIYIIERGGLICNALNGQLELFGLEKLIIETAELLDPKGSPRKLRIKDVFVQQRKATSI